MTRLEAYLIRCAVAQGWDHVHTATGPLVITVEMAVRANNLLEAVS